MTGQTMRDAPSILVGTAGGTWTDQAGRDLLIAGHRITAMAREGDTVWAITDGSSLHRSHDSGEWAQIAALTAPARTCLLPSSERILIGTEGAHVTRFSEGADEPLPAFDAVDGRADWFTPWGGPPATRSMALDVDGDIYVNVHVGGIVKSTAGGDTWQATGLDIRADAHQIIAHPVTGGLAVAAIAGGMAVSDDGGDSWRVHAEGLHARYARAAAVAGETVSISVSEEPSGGHAALYRRPLAGDGPFEKCAQGLPDWFDANIDTYTLAARDDVVVFGTDQGTAYASNDAGATWREIARGLPEVTSVVLAA